MNRPRKYLCEPPISKEDRKRMIIERIFQTVEAELIKAQLVNVQHTMVRRVTGKSRDIAKWQIAELINEEWK